MSKLALISMLILEINFFKNSTISFFFQVNHPHKPTFSVMTSSLWWTVSGILSLTAVTE